MRFRTFLMMILTVLSACAGSSGSGLSPQEEKFERLLKNWRYLPSRESASSSDVRRALSSYLTDWSIPNATNDQAFDYLERTSAETKSQDMKVLGKECFVKNPYPQPAETISWTGRCVSGLPDGDGVMTWRHLSKGKWVEEVYDGRVSGGIYHGNGSLTYSSGAQYVGRFRNGDRHGNGTMKYRNGGIYTGGFANGARDGQGRYEYPDGTIYVGGWKSDKQNGSGRADHANGSSYNGNWKNGMPNGQGTITDALGDTFSGQFVEGCSRTSDGQPRSFWAAPIDCMNRS